MTERISAAGLDQHDKDTLGYLGAFPQIGEALKRRIEEALLRGLRLQTGLRNAEEIQAEWRERAEAAEAKVARVEALRLNYAVRAEYAPTPLAQWADIESDLRAALDGAYLRGYGEAGAPSASRRLDARPGRRRRVARETGRGGLGA